MPIYIDVDRDRYTGQLQVSISRRDKDGLGYGYRIAGPKYTGSSENLIRHKLTERDANEIRTYINNQFPPESSQQ